MTRKSILATLGIVGACGVCCAALLVPVILGTGGAEQIGGGWALGVSLDFILCVILPALLLLGGGWWYWRRRSRSAAARGCDCADKCDPAGCGAAPSGP